MQHYKRPRQSFPVRLRRSLSLKWVRAVALAFIAVLMFAAVWFAWPRLPQSEPAPTDAAAPSVSATPVSSPSAAVFPSPTPAPTAVPTPTLIPQAAVCHPGDSGEDVKLLQSMLLTLGFDPGEADGSYGKQMENAVCNFQLYAGLSVDGIAGPETVSTLTQHWQTAQQHQQAEQQPLAGCVIGIDPGHQRISNEEQEPISPGSSETKVKVSSGTEGQFTGVPEYVVNLQVALKLRDALEALGAQVVMTREAHDVDIPNSKRAQMMNEANVDCWLRVHANYSPNSGNHGMFILIPAKGGLDTDDLSVVQRSERLAEALLESTLAATGADDSRGLEERDDQTGFGWSQVPVCNIELGYMSNETEDRLLVTEAYQQKIVAGLTTGFIRYFTD